MVLNLAETSQSLWGYYLCSTSYSKIIINWVRSNSVNTYDRHSHWHNLTGYATKEMLFARAFLKQIPSRGVVNRC